MTTRMTVFTATLVQDSAISVSGLDRDSSSDQPFAIDAMGPILVGRGLKGAAVAMARRFFEPLPRNISEDANRHDSLRRSAWEFAHARPEDPNMGTTLRAGVGIRHKTGARAVGVLYDREVLSAGTRWRLEIRVDWSYVGSAGDEVEGILSYVLAEHWAKGHCWLGGGAARGLGWCHIEDLKMWRLDSEAYDRWVVSGRSAESLPAPLSPVPRVEPTRSWCFRTLDIELQAGEHRIEAEGPAWGVDMLAVGPHDTERSLQAAGNGTWARPSWVDTGGAPRELPTDNAILMEGDRPLIPGASLRGAMRHAYSRILRAHGRNVEDPHLVRGDVGVDDPAGELFGSVSSSSRVLIRDGRTGADWTAALLHMHAEDEFSAGSYGSAKRDAVHLLQARIPIRIVVEGPSADVVEPIVDEIDHLVALGALGHLPLGGNKTRGGGGGRWLKGDWQIDDVENLRPGPATAVESTQSASPQDHDRRRDELEESPPPPVEDVWVRVVSERVEQRSLTLGQAATMARSACDEASLFAAWWCEPTIDLDRTEPPATFGFQWPEQTANLQVDEVVFFFEHAAWRAARISTGMRWVLIKEVDAGTPEAKMASVVEIPARFDRSGRFQTTHRQDGLVRIREWRVGKETLGYTAVPTLATRDTRPKEASNE